VFITDYDHAGDNYAVVDNEDDGYNNNVRTPTPLHHLLWGKTSSLKLQLLFYRKCTFIWCSHYSSQKDILKIKKNFSDCCPHIYKNASLKCGTNKFPLLS